MGLPRKIIGCTRARFINGVDSMVMPLTILFSTVLRKIKIPVLT